MTSFKQLKTWWYFTYKTTSYCIPNRCILKTIHITCVFHAKWTMYTYQKKAPSSRAWKNELKIPNKQDTTESVQARPSIYSCIYPISRTFRIKKSFMQRLTWIYINSRWCVDRELIPMLPCQEVQAVVRTEQKKKKHAEFASDWCRTCMSVRTTS